MNATKILWGQVLLVSATVLAFVWTATEWTAWKLGFSVGAWPPMVRGVRLAGLPSAGLFLVVVRLRRLCARHFLSRAHTSPLPGALRPSWSPSPFRCGAPARRSVSRPMALPAGQRCVRCARPACSGKMGCCSAGGGTNISDMMGRNMCSASRRPEAARVSGLSSRRC